MNFKLYHPDATVSLRGRLESFVSLHSLFLQKSFIYYEWTARKITRLENWPIFQKVKTFKLYNGFWTN